MLIIRVMEKCWRLSCGGKTLEHKGCDVNMVKEKILVKNVCHKTMRDFKNNSKHSMVPGCGTTACNKCTEGDSNFVDIKYARILISDENV